MFSYGNQPSPRIRIVTQPPNFIPRLDAGTALGNVQPNTSSRTDHSRRHHRTNRIAELPSNVYIPAADIVMVVDESGSMEEQSWIASMVQALETELDSRNIDDTRFAIVGFGGPNSLPHVVKETPIMKCGCMVRVVDSCSGPSSKKDSRYAWLQP